jgi:hypothetical protein
LKENETDATDTNHSIYVAAIAITETIAKRDKTRKNVMKKESRKIRLQRQRSNWKNRTVHTC